MPTFDLGKVVGPEGPRGPVGRAFVFEDFTEEQLNDLALRAVPAVLAAASICYVATTAPANDEGKNGDICVVMG